MSDLPITRGLWSLFRGQVQCDPLETASQLPSRRPRSSRSDGWESEPLLSQDFPLWYGDLVANPCHWLPYVRFHGFSTPFTTWRSVCRRSLSIEIFVQQVNCVVGIVCFLPTKSAVIWALWRVEIQMKCCIVSPELLLVRLQETGYFSPVQVR